MTLAEHEREHIVFACAHTLALLERAPSHWARPGAVDALVGVMNRLAPPPLKEERDAAVPMPLRVARKHIGELLKGERMGVREDAWQSLGDAAAKVVEKIKP